jgi:FdhD protein
VPKHKSAVFYTQVTEWDNGSARRVGDYLAGEEPLEIRVNEFAFGVTLRTPGNDLDLVRGLLFSEGVIAHRNQILSAVISDESDSIEEPSKANRVAVRLSAEARIPRKKPVRRFSAGSACGVCGKAAIDELRNRGISRPDAESRFDPHILCQLPEKLRSEQANFSRTGGLHAAGLFDARGELIVLREDIGRHNAVDKVIGWALEQEKIPLKGHMLLASGRGGFEIVQKAIVAGIPLLASVSAPSSLAVQLARELGITLVGFLRGQRFVTYAGDERLVLPVTAAELP